VIDGLKKEGFAGLDALASQLNDRGIATVRGGKWYASSVRNLLKRLPRLISN
jgi:hypothetical protein